MSLPLICSQIDPQINLSNIVQSYIIHCCRHLLDLRNDLIEGNVPELNPSYKRKFKKFLKFLKISVLLISADFSNCFPLNNSGIYFQKSGQLASCNIKFGQKFSDFSAKV